MPFTTEQLAAAGKASIDYFLKNDPIDQVNIAHPWLKKLSENKSEYAGGLQYVVEQLRFQNDSNFQSYFGDSQVTFNRKRTLQQAKYMWGSFHDGFGLNEDELAQNGIIVNDDKNTVPSDAEVVMLTNLLKENQETLKLGFQNGLDIVLHRSGAQSTTDIPGLDNLVSLSPSSSSVVGALNQQTYSWWRNYAKTDMTAVTDQASAITFINDMEVAWRECTRYGGSEPDFILAGYVFMDNYRKACQLLPGQFVTTTGNVQKGGITRDGGTTGLYFHGVELVWDPVFDLLETLDTTGWIKRCYFLNMKFIKLRPIKGHWMISRKPPRVYDRYIHYWALTAKAALSTGKRNALAVLKIT